MARTLTEGESRIGLGDMTDRQARAVRRIMEQALTRFRESADGMEFKDGTPDFTTFYPEAPAHTRWVYVNVKAGKVGDEGTMGEIFCRNRGLFMVGPRGGIKALSSSYRRPPSKAKLAKYPLIYGWDD